MSPFLQFRVWLRHGPRGEHVLVGLTALCVVALLAWAFVPVDNDPSEVAAGGATVDAPTAPVPVAEEVAAAGGAASPASGTTSPLPSAGETNGDAASARPSDARSSDPAVASASNGCDALRSTDQGVSDKEIFVAVPIINLAGGIGNETFGIRSDLDRVVGAAVAAINAEGGVACRKLRAKIYRVNPIDANEQRARCLEVAGDKPFAVIDIAADVNETSRTCYVQQRIPFLGESAISEREAAAGRPYLFALRASIDRQLRNFVFGAAERGIFQDPRFKKLGVLVDACVPEVAEQLQQNLRKVGLRGDQISTFTSSCEATASAPQLSQAVAQHRRDGASHVLLAASIIPSQTYVRQADGLGWRPSYLVSDYGGNTGTAGAQRQWSAGFQGAIGITSTRQGELNSGVVTPLRRQCQEWMKAGGVEPSSDDGDASYWVCDLFRLFKAMGDASGPGLVRTGLAEALGRVGAFESTHYGDAVYDRPGKVWGGDRIRSNEWLASCTCWKIRDREAGPGH